MEEYVFRLHKHGLQPYYDGVIRHMIARCDLVTVAWSLENTFALMGVQSRTGYLCPVVKHGYASRVVAFAEYLGDVVAWVKERKSMRECIMLLREVMTKGDGFHLYEVDMVCTEWGRLQNHEHGLRLVSGPGMLPMVLAMLGKMDLLFDEEHEQRRGEGEFGENVVQAAPREKKKQKTTKKGSWSEVVMATSMCQYLAKLVATNALVLAVCAYLGITIAGVVN